MEPPVKPLCTISCTVSFFQGGLSGTHPALLCSRGQEELGVPEPLTEVGWGSRFTLSAQPPPVS